MRLRWPWKSSAAAAPVSRWLVVDVESTGLDPYSDRLLAIAGVAVRFEHGRLFLEPSDSFEVVLQQETPTNDKSNILIHGIGVGAQRNGMPPAEALRAFETWASDAVFVAFHAPFDEAMIQRAMHQFMGHKLTHRWLDLAFLAPLAMPAEKARSLDEWMDLRGITCAVRHQAVADAWATAQLLQSIWPTLQAQGEPVDAEALRRRTEQLRWLARSR